MSMKEYKVWGIATLVIIAIIGGICLMMGNRQISYAESTVSQVNTQQGYFYYNSQVQGTDHPYNYGPDRGEAGASSSKNPAEGGKKDFLDSACVGRVAVADPALAAAVMYHVQSETGENILDINLDISYADTQINNVHETFRKDKNYGESSSKKLEALLNKSSVRTEDIQDYTSQSGMVANSASFDSAAPKIVWGKSEHVGGHWLIFTVNGKDVKFRFECGYQFEAKKYVSNKKDDEPIVNPDEPVTPWKDPSKDPVYQGNANRGGGMNLPTDGTGNFQEDRPPWQPGGNTGGGTGGGGTGGGVTPTPAPHIDPQPKDPAIEDDPEVHGRL